MAEKTWNFAGPVGRLSRGIAEWLTIAAKEVDILLPPGVSVGDGRQIPVPGLQLAFSWIDMGNNYGEDVIQLPKTSLADLVFWEDTTWEKASEWFGDITENRCPCQFEAV